MDKKFNSCEDCAHYNSFTFSYCWSSEQIEKVEPYCGVTNSGNLWTFPFERTKCKLFKQHVRQG